MSSSVWRCANVTCRAPLGAVLDGVLEPIAGVRVKVLPRGLVIVRCSCGEVAEWKPQRLPPGRVARVVSSR